MKGVDENSKIGLLKNTKCSDHHNVNVSRVFKLSVPQYISDIFLPAIS